MSVAEYVAGDLFTVEVHKQMAASPEDAWVNTYEFRATDAGFYGTLQALASRWAGFEQALTYNSVYFTHVHVRTLLPESPQLDVDFLNVPIDSFGAAGSPSLMAPLDTCLFINREVDTGRLGKLMLRAVLPTTSFTSAGGKRTLTDPTAWTVAVAGALSSSGADGDVGFGGDVFELIMHRDTLQVRVVTELSVAGVALVKLKHKWFNRAPATPQN